MKKTIRLTESDLHNIIKNAVRHTILETKKNNSSSGISVFDIINSMRPAFISATGAYDSEYLFGPRDLSFKLDKDAMRDYGYIFAAKIIMNPYTVIGEIWKDGYKGGYIGRINNTLMDDFVRINACSFRGDTIEDLMFDMVYEINKNIDFDEEGEQYDKRVDDNAEEFDDDTYDINQYESKNRIINKIVKESIDNIKK